MLLQSHLSRDVSTIIQDMAIKGFAYQAHQRQSQSQSHLVLSVSLLSIKYYLLLKLSSFEFKNSRSLVWRLAWYTHHFKVLRHGSHSLTCKKNHACLYFVSVHQMAPSPIEVVKSNCSSLLIYRFDNVTTHCTCCHVCFLPQIIHR